VEQLGVAFALFLIFEGLMPFIMPNMWRKKMLDIAKQPDNIIRNIGFVSIMIGLVLLYFLK